MANDALSLLNGIDNVDEEMDVECPPFLEPDIQINLTEDDNSTANFILPVDSNYTNEQFVSMLKKSFQKCDQSCNAILSDANEVLVCKECNSDLNYDHFMKKGICAKCNYVTHCKKAYTQHMIEVHSSQKCTKPSIPPSVLSNLSNHLFNLTCQTCQFHTNQCNEMGIVLQLCGILWFINAFLLLIASHMTKLNHYFTRCIPLE